MDTDINTPLMNNPKVSVLMPVYNGEKYISEAVDSVLNQTFADFELIIVNDGSTDNSISLIESYKDQRIKLFHNEKNRGLSFTRNKCIEYAKGEYLAMLDCDDITLTTRLEEQVKFLNDHPDYGLIGAWVQFIDGNGKEGDVMAYTASADEIPSILFFHNYFAQSAVMLRKSCLPEQWYREEFPPTEDYDLWVRISHRCKVWNLQKVLTKYRVHTTNTSFTQSEKALASEKAILMWQLKDMGLPFSEEDFEIYFSICKNRFLEEETFLIKLQILVQNLKKANHDTKVYAEPYFSNSFNWFNELLERYRFKKFIKPKKLSLNHIKEFYFSPLHHYKSIPKEARIKFIIKRLIG